MKVSIVMPNYNGSKLLKKNLPKVLAARGDGEIIVVDDCSTDNSLEVLKDFGVKVIVNEKNMGFSSTVNRGVREAKGDIVVLLNTDVSPEKNFLEPLVAHFKDPKVFGVGCMDKSVEDDTIVLRGRGIGKWARGFFVHSRGEVDKTNTLWVSGGSCAISKAIWEKFGGFDELYNPFYWEDIDLCYRALKAGYKVLFEQKSVVIHEHEKGAIKSEYSPFQVKIIAYRNQFIFVWRNVNIGLLLLHIAWLPYHFVKAFVRADLAFFLGFFSAYSKIPLILDSRKKGEKSFIKTDSEIINGLS